MKKTLFVVLITAVVLLVTGFLIPPKREANGQSSSRIDSSKTIQQDFNVQQSFEEKFWNYLQSAKYENWAPSPGTDGRAYDGESPHGAKLKMYLNRTAISNPKKLPHGSIIVKENYGPDAKKLMAITVMYRTKGFDKENNDWYWIKYLPDGKVARTPADKGNMPIRGKFKSCIKCHDDADGDDFAFFND